MKIGVVSDTHCHAIPKQVINDFKHVDLIVHAGDFCTLAEAGIFENLKKVVGVCGNMDGEDVRKKYPEKQVFECDGVKIGVYHGAGAKSGILEQVKEKFAGDDVDVVIFGHSHEPLNKKIGNVLYFNPGSPNDNVFAPYRSYGILDIASGKAAAKIIKVKD